MDCNILISLVPERKPLKIASKLGFLTPGLDEMDESEVKSTKMWIERTFDLDLTIYVKQSHKTYKFDPNK